MTTEEPEGATNPAANETGTNPAADETMPQVVDENGMIHRHATVMKVNGRRVAVIVVTTVAPDGQVVHLATRIRPGPRLR